MMERMHIEHPFAPVFDENSQILILGSFPSVKSREVSFYYGHPQNRFWRVLAALFHSDVPSSVQEKQRFLLDHRIALWDVIASCDISGSFDSSIRNAVPNDIAAFLADTKISRVFTNGGTAYRLYHGHVEQKTGIAAVALPSTSPANAAYSLERLVDAWRAAGIGAGN